MSHLGKPTTKDSGVSRSRVKFVFEICIRRDARRSTRSNVCPLERGKVRLIRAYRCNDLRNRLAKIDVKIVRNNEKRAEDRDRMISLDFEIENTVLRFVERSAVVKKKKKKKKQKRKRRNAGSAVDEIYFGRTLDIQKDTNGRDVLAFVINKQTISGFAEDSPTAIKRSSVERKIGRRPYGRADAMKICRPRD